MRWNIHHLGVTANPEAGLPKATIVFGLRTRSAPIDARGAIELRNATLLVWGSESSTDERWLDGERVVVRLAGKSVIEVSTRGIHAPGDLREAAEFGQQHPLVRKALALIWNAGQDLLNAPDSNQITWGD